VKNDNNYTDFVVIGPVCGFVTAGRVRAGGGCYHDNSKMRASIFTKLGL